MSDDLEAVAGSDDGVSVHTGFPNPAIDRRGQPRLALDLNRLLVQHPSSTFLFRVAGHRWSDQGLHDGDIAVVDRSAARRPERLVVIWQDSGFVILRQRQLSSSSSTPAWGVVTAIIRQYDT